MAIIQGVRWIYIERSFFSPRRYTEFHRVKILQLL